MAMLIPGARPSTTTAIIQAGAIAPTRTRTRKARVCQYFFEFDPTPTTCTIMHRDNGDAYGPITGDYKCATSWKYTEAFHQLIHEDDDVFQTLQTYTAVRNQDGSAKYKVDARLSTASRFLAGSCMSAKVCIGQTRRRIAARTTTTLRRSTALARMRQSTRFVLLAAGSAAPMRPKRARGRGRTAPRGTTRTA